MHPMIRWVSHFDLSVSWLPHPVDQRLNVYFCAVLGAALRCVRRQAKEITSIIIYKLILYVSSSELLPFYD